MALIYHYNRHLRGSDWESFVGEIMIPARRLEGTIVVDVGNRHRQEVFGNDTTTFISARINKIIKKINNNIAGDFSQLCNYTTGMCWKRQTVIEPDPKDQPLY